MSDAHFASLSSTLLARKGGAKPAMRPQSAVLGPVDGVAAAANLEDLGWNDMGEDVAPMPEAPAPTMRQGGSASLAESGLIKKPALPPIDQRDDFDPYDMAPSPEHNAYQPAAEIVPLNTRRNEEPEANDNQVRNSLARIVSQLHNTDASEPPTAETEPARAEAETVTRSPEPTAPAKAAPAKAATAKGKRAAFTLRLDPERHLMLKLACTVRGSSAQQLVTDALDGLLAEMPEIAMLAAQVQRRPN